MTTESFNHVTDAISNTNAALSAYDSLTERITVARETVESLEVDISTLRTNAGVLDARARASKFASANSALSLAKSDLQSLQDDLAAQKTLAVTTGKAAARALFDVRDLLRM